MIGYKDGTRQIILKLVQDQLLIHFGKIQNMLLVLLRNQQWRNSKISLQPLKKTLKLVLTDLTLDTRAKRNKY